MMLAKKELKLEVGKKYLNTRGDVIGPIIKTPNYSTLCYDYPFCCSVSGRCFTAKGEYWDNRQESQFNLISEYTEVAPNGYTEDKTTVELPKDFVLEAHRSACDTWQRKIEKQLPELFKKSVTIGKWYKNKLIFGSLFCVTNISSNNNAFGGYGFERMDTGRPAWIDESGNEYFPISGATPASDEEVKESLLAEAKRRGYKDGNYKCLVGKTMAHSDNYRYHPENNKVTSGYVNGCANVVFDDGKWAKIEETKQTELTLEQIAEKFNVPVSQLRIKD